MPDAPVLAALHFLRPAWLLLVPLAILLGWLYLKRRDALARYGDFVAPHLLKHLIVGGNDRRRVGPALVFVALGLAGVAVAGPTWKREPSPFADDKAAVVLAIDGSSTMTTKDIAPSRLERAKQKARDLLGFREGGRTGLVLYGGSAHVVLPLTDDIGILELYVGSLESSILPKQGKRPDLALAAAQGLLDRDATPGTIVLLTDELPGADVLRAHRRAGGAPVRVLRVAPGPGGDVDGAAVTSLTADDRDVQALDEGIARHLAAAQAADGTTRWKDMGWYLLIPLVFAAALWFRRGWSARWATVWLLAALVFGAEPAHAHESALENAFRTPDQQGRVHFEKGQFDAAAAHFENPRWKAVAYYRAGKYELADAWFAKSDDAWGWFNRGNALVKLERLTEAANAYRRALDLEPDAPDARENLQIVLAVIKKREEEEPAKGGSMLKPDEIVMSDKNDTRKRPEQEEITFDQAMDERMADVWLRQVQTTPAAFLRSKFAIQESARKEEDDK